MSFFESLGLSKEQIEKRKNTIGGSDANTIMSGNEDWITSLWEQKCGISESEDLSDVLPVVMGQYTEELNAHWYEKQTGDKVVKRNEYFVHPDNKVMAANLDGVCLLNQAIWEAKHVNQMSKDEEVIQRYMPQLYHNADVYGVKKAVISVFRGTLNWFCFEVDIQDSYLNDLKAAELHFWECVQNKTPPYLIEKIEPPAFDDMREIDMTGNNQWASYANDIVSNQDAAKKFDKAKSEIKGLVEFDVKKAHGHGVSISRNKKGSLVLKVD